MTVSEFRDLLDKLDDSTPLVFIWGVEEHASNNLKDFTIKNEKGFINEDFTWVNEDTCLEEDIDQCKDTYSIFIEASI